MNKENITVNVNYNNETYDVVVVGGGPAGIGAALSASKMGANTLLIESSHNFGGVANKAMFMPFNRLYVDGSIRGGVLSDFVEKITSLGDMASIKGKSNFTDGGGIDIHPDYFQLTIFDLLDKYQCKFRLYSTVVDVTKDGNKVTSVIIATKTGFEKIKGKIFIDATGDGDLAFSAGEEYMEGEENTGRHMPTSIVFMLGNVDVDKAIEFQIDNNKKYNSFIQKARDEGYQTNVWYAYDRTTIPNTINVNNGGPFGYDNIDATNTHHLTLLTKIGIKAAIHYVEFSRKYKIPGLEDCYLLRTGAAAVRDTRRFIGEYVVTLEDAEKGAHFDDIVSRKYGNVDANQLYIGKMKSGYGFPYRAMLPRSIDGLLLAGRCCSSTFMGHAAGKSMGNMMEIGQAAGVAAAMCSIDGLQPRNLDLSKLKTKLHEWSKNI